MPCGEGKKRCCLNKGNGAHRGEVALMRNKVSASEYLAFLSAKYDVGPSEFFDALISAAESGVSTCGNLSIESRGTHQNKVVLLITNGTKVVAQFPVSKEFLFEQTRSIKGLSDTSMFRRRLINKNNGPHSFQIRDLKAGMKKVNIKAKVLEIAKPSLVFTRFGNYASVANALISDETGSIKMCLWNEQISSVCTGDTVQIENGSISTFRGEKQLRVGRKGAFHVVDGSASSLEEVQDP
jgi:replication factor A1